MCKVRFAKWGDRPATAAQQCSRHGYLVREKDYQELEHAMKR
jgi:hypothetical protein